MWKAFAAIFLASFSVAASARDICTSDGRFTYCPWGQLTGCKLLDQKLLRSDAFSDAERSLIRAVQSHTRGSRKFDLNALAKEFGTKAFQETLGPGDMVISWPLDTPGSDVKTMVGFGTQGGRIQLAGVSVAKKFTVRWCAKG